ncbi:MAG: hypothetical protein Q9166_003956 [cf. Caloplaca sp. 2 TL-2023]
MTEKTFFNSSARGFNTNGTAEQGAMHYVPSFGPNGLFMIMGGTNFTDPDNNIDFENIWVYESLENKWYNQTATGGVDSNARNNYGSTDDINESAFNSSVDPFAQGLGIFDMTTLRWADHYTANAPPYVQSDLVKRFYNDNPQTGAQFSSGALRDLFAVTHFSQTPSSASDPSPTPELSPSSSSNTAAIAGGGVVGGVVGLALIAGIAFFLFRRRRRAQKQYPANPKPSGYHISELQGEAPMIQEADPGAAFYEMGPEYRGGQGVQGQKPVEMEGARPEMGYDEVNGMGRRPLEMEASEARR